jgi:hypothetical protein
MAHGLSHFTRQECCPIRITTALGSRLPPMVKGKDDQTTERAAHDNSKTTEELLSFQEFGVI